MISLSRDRKQKQLYHSVTGKHLTNEHQIDIIDFDEHISLSPMKGQGKLAFLIHQRHQSRE